MRSVSILVVIAVLALAGSSAAAAAQPAGWKAVLIAGSNAEPAFDNAVEAAARQLVQFGVPRRNITLLEASGRSAPRATRANIRAAFARLDPAPDQGCFVFVTSHGIPGRGLVLSAGRSVLSPGALDRLLDRACGARPSVVVASGCYSGIYADAPPLPAANRVILTAARADRPSFGCNASLRYTVFDGCWLESLARGRLWAEVMDKTRQCVGRNERELRVAYPSEPQLFVGAKEAGLRAFAAGRRG